MRIFRVRYGILALISLMYFITYIDRTNISVAAPIIASDLHLSQVELGLMREPAEQAKLPLAEVGRRHGGDDAADAAADAERRDRIGRLRVERLLAGVREILGPEHEGLRPVAEALA